MIALWVRKVEHLDLSFVPEYVKSGSVSIETLGSHS